MQIYMLRFMCVCVFIGGYHEFDLAPFHGSCGFVSHFGRLDDGWLYARGRKDVELGTHANSIHGDRKKADDN